MAQFWTRTRRYMAVLWLATAVVEAIVLVLAIRRNDSWFLLLAVAVLAVPLVAAEMTSRWLGRAPRKRWKRHDVEDAIKAGREPEPTVPVVPGVPPAGA